MSRYFNLVKLLQLKVFMIFIAGFFCLDWAANCFLCLKVWLPRAVTVLLR